MEATHATTSDWAQACAIARRLLNGGTRAGVIRVENAPRLIGYGIRSRHTWAVVKVVNR